VRQALQAARFVTPDEQKQEKVVRAMLTILQEADFHCTPPEIAHKVHFSTLELLNVRDPYKKVKQESNEIVLGIYDTLQEEVTQSNNPFTTALRFSIAGNIMDYGAHHSFDIFQTVENSKK
jgi:uncharacterized protein with ATP-grasp and redox domains